MAEKFWKVARKWEGQDAFILCGGTSVTREMIESIRGRNVIAINSSYMSAMWAPILFFADQRWWVREMKERPMRINAFKGLIATTSRQAVGKRLLRLRRTQPDVELPTRPDTVALRRTGMISGMDIAYHRGAKRIILIGADNRDGDDGRVHHHEEYPWARPANTWDVKLDDIHKRAEAFAKAGIPIINCSPISTIKCWPKRPLEEVLAEIDKEKTDGNR